MSGQNIGRGHEKSLKFDKIDEGSFFLQIYVHVQLGNKTSITDNSKYLNLEEK
jgi:hypothetical protein